MRRVLMMLARLYPAEWRARYGAEFDALLEDRKPRKRDVLDVLWGGVRMQMTAWNPLPIVLVCSFLGLLTALAVSFTRQQMYISQTLVSVYTAERHSLRNELAGDAQDLFTQPSLAAIIQRENLYPGERARLPQKNVIELMKRGIFIRSVQVQGADGRPASAFFLQFAYPDPRVAQRVDEELTSLLLSSQLQRRINDPSATSLGPVVFRVDHTANLPQKPFFPRQEVFGAGGLLAGLVVGLSVMAMAGWRRKRIVSAG